MTLGLIKFLKSGPRPLAYPACHLDTHTTLFFDSLDTQKSMLEFDDDDFSLKIGVEVVV